MTSALVTQVSAVLLAQQQSNAELVSRISALHAEQLAHVLRAVEAIPRNGEPLLAVRPPAAVHEEPVIDVAPAAAVAILPAALVADGSSAAVPVAVPITEPELVAATPEPNAVAVTVVPESRPASTLVEPESADVGVVLDAVPPMVINFTSKNAPAIDQTKPTTPDAMDVDPSVAVAPISIDEALADAVPDVSSSSPAAVVVPDESSSCVIDSGSLGPAHVDVMAVPTSVRAVDDVGDMRVDARLAVANVTGTSGHDLICSGTV